MMERFGSVMLTAASIRDLGPVEQNGKPKGPQSGPIPCVSSIDMPSI